MPLLTIKPPRQTSEPGTGTAPDNTSNNSFTARPVSPVAPAFSPITPKQEPVFPIAYSPEDALQNPSIPQANYAHTTMTDSMQREHAAIKLEDQTPPVNPLGAIRDASIPNASPIQPTQYIAQPLSLPFSSEDSTDAIALRAALSSLQFQKQKAQQDLRTLETLKRQALADPEKFKDDLVAGRLKEQRPDFGSIRDILDAASEDGDDEDEVLLGAAREATAEVPDSQPGSFNANRPPSSENASPVNFPTIPGPQNVVRMPPINWEKYKVVGEALDALYEQQRQWPGSMPGQRDRGREHMVAAPYSPFTDTLAGHGGQAGHGRNGSDGLQTGSLMHSPSVTGTVSEHPMETRRSGNRHA